MKRIPHNYQLEDTADCEFFNRYVEYGVVNNHRQYYPMRARTGTHIHVAQSGSSVAECGWWHRGHAIEVSAPVNCQHCLDRAPVLSALINAQFLEPAI